MHHIYGIYGEGEPKRDPIVVIKIFLLYNNLFICIIIICITPKLLYNFLIIRLKLTMCN